jgi:hypothetical protein
MTFEEFLIKKKIDPVLLKTAEQLLFFEFENHFIQMGEKSFDHSKKFWFNKLRRTYHLKEEAKPARVEADTSKLPPSATKEQETNSSLTEPAKQEKSAYIPRFKAGPIQKEELPAETDTPPAYKPRFKTAIKIQEQAEDTNLNKEPESGEKVKPVYKPRFKAQIAAPEAPLPENKEESPPQPNDQPKPAYKPRFKPGLTKKGPGAE